MPAAFQDSICCRWPLLAIFVIDSEMVANASADVRGWDLQNEGCESFDDRMESDRHYDETALSLFTHTHQ
jgi:hypothetical protein